jgi:alpha-L-arabinofuranosidase
MKSHLLTGLLLLAGAGVCFTTQAQTTATLTIHAEQPGAVVSSNLFGIFFEEINVSGEGGLYAEMVRNRSFYNAASADYWTLVTQGTATGSMTVDAGVPLNTNILNSLRLVMDAGTGSVGAGNAGFWGMTLSANAQYDLSFYACTTNGPAAKVTARLESSDGLVVYTQTNFAGITNGWQKFSAPLISSATDTNARLVLSLTNSGTIWLNMVSLFPHDTFKGHTNGLRRDLAQMLEAMKPSFFRFPGGNFIEGYNVTNAVRWKKSIGDVAQRPGHLNDAWNYWSTDGFGVDEFFQFCKDLGMEPLYGINAGLMLGYNGAANNTVALADMGPWVQDALDLIEYSNGSTNTTWGAVRAANGHPDPYGLKYLEIGNENGGSYYNDRYTLFYDAIKAKYPEVRLISPNWGTPPWSRPIEILDEHYYTSAATFTSYATKYDSYSRNGYKVFVGEYAVAWASPPATFPATLQNALGEAAFMTGLERNADLVLMSCYAPMLCNMNDPDWYPDMIYFSGTNYFGTPSYYVQKMFSETRGDVVLPNTIVLATNGASAALHGAIGLGSWNTSVQYTNIVVASNGVTLYQSDFVNAGANGWQVYNGTWSTNTGLYQQTSASTTDCRATTGNTNWSNYTISLRARKVSGSEGFLILFNWTDDNNWTWWNVGGWGNTKDGIEQNVAGSKTTLASVSQTAIANNVWYDLRIVLSGSRMQCYLGTNAAQVATNLVQDVYYPGGLLASTTFARNGQQILIKAVNPYSVPVAANINLVGVSSLAATGTVVQLTSASPSDQNSFATPTYVSPVTNHISGVTTNFTLNLPAYSLSVIKLAGASLNTYTSLLVQCASPVYSGQSTAAKVLGERSGAWVDLTANTNYAVVWSSANTNVATVDMYGNVAAVASGTADIIATYPGLNLAATQSVQVVTVPATLVHRYSFSETSGTTVADSVGGSAWDGSLPQGGTFTGSQVILDSSLQQYIQLPAGILSNYTQVTIETWLSITNQLPSACFLFGFGNISGNTGYNYIFCQPKNGRIAITAGSYGGEQNANSGTDFSYRTNLHVTAVFNPPAGYLALYTNGVLAAKNSAVTVPFTSVSNLFSYVGRSLYSNDAYFNANWDEFRIYSGALLPSEIAATELLGADQVLATNNPSVNIAGSASSLTFGWPAASAGFTLQTRTNLVLGSWADVTTAAPQLTNGQWQVVLPPTENARFYRLRR